MDLRELLDQCEWEQLLEVSLVGEKVDDDEYDDYDEEDEEDWVDEEDDDYYDDGT